MPIDVAMNKPGTEIVRPEPNPDWVGATASNHITAMRIYKVGSSTGCTLNDVEGVSAVRDSRELEHRNNVPQKNTYCKWKACPPPPINWISMTAFGFRTNVCSFTPNCDLMDQVRGM